MKLGNGVKGKVGTEYHLWYRRRLWRSWTKGGGRMQDAARSPEPNTDAERSRRGIFCRGRSQENYLWRMSSPVIFQPFDGDIVRRELDDS